jgi:uncharacterized membrane protein YgaE (UPF0421/DUF939 family)
MAAVQPTFIESLESCLAQIIGVIFGALAGLLLLAIKLPPLVAIGFGIVLLITLYNVMGIRYSPNLPCLILVMLCTIPNTPPITYALGRIWDTAIGLGVGILINMLIFPYDNRRQICNTIDTLDKKIILFLEDMFDGDDVIPDAREMTRSINSMEQQLYIFSNQKFLFKMRRQRQDLETFRVCEGKARELLARMEILSRVGRPGRLNAENRRRLRTAGAQIRDERPLDSVTERDVVTNYHVKQILTLRRELLDALRK